MKKTVQIVLTVMLLLLTGNSYAMTDKEVMTQVIQMYQTGMDEMEIAKSLIAQGATMDQLQRVKEQADQLMTQSGSMKSSTSSNTTVSDVTRMDNGENPLMTYLNAGGMSAGCDIFGHDFFRPETAGFTPSMSQATPKDYVLGPDDEVIIDIYGASQLQIKSVITPDGIITVSNYGPVRLAGLTLQEATRRLKTTIGTRYQNSQIMLTIGQIRSINVNVMGEVPMPGTYRLSAFADVFSALTLAGGVTEKGTLRDIKVYRAGNEISSVDIYSYLMDGKLAGNVRLEDGDIIIVGTYQELVNIEGKVKRPMSYEMKKGETVDKLLYFAGGFGGEAYTDAVRIFRRNAGSRSVNTVKNSDFAQYAVMDGDSVKVEAILPRLKNTVNIQGAVFRNGYYGMSEQLHTVKQLVEAADGPAENAFLGRAVLYRMKLDRTLQAVAIDLKGILDGTVADIELKNEDQLFVPSMKNQIENQYVVIHGEVFKPDTFSYADNESVEDLILRAGGLTARASTSKVDVSRRIIDAKATEETQIKTESHIVTLNDSLMVNEHGFILKPFDEVYVRLSPAYGRQMNVSVRGEVLFSGIYSMKTQDDRLSDLIKAAGGLSSHAYVKGARLKRRMTPEELLRREQLLKINKAASAKDSVNTDKLDLGTTYWVGIDLEAALASPGCDDDITLREGDELHIPNINKTVKINGEVLYPNTVSYIKGKRAKFYIEQAGGYSNQARRIKAYVIYPNGKVAPARRGKIQPGSEIVVPTRPEKKASNAAQAVAIASSAASIASVGATITTLVINMTKKSE